MSLPPSSNSAPGWYSDPLMGGRQRWWDGTRWSDPAVDESTELAVDRGLGGDPGSLTAYPLFEPPDHDGALPLGGDHPADLVPSESTPASALPDQPARKREFLETIFRYRNVALSGLGILGFVLLYTWVPLGATVLVIGVLLYVITGIAYSRKVARGQSRSNALARPLTPPPAAKDMSPAQRITWASQYLQVIDFGLPKTEQISVAGESRRRANIRAVFRDSGMPLTTQGQTLENVPACLVPDPWDDDPNAVAVLINDRPVGSLPKVKAVQYGPALLGLAKQGVAITCTARLWGRLENGSANVEITLLAPQASSLPQPGTAIDEWLV